MPFGWQVRLWVGTSIKQFELRRHEYKDRFRGFHHACKLRRSSSSNQTHLSLHDHIIYHITSLASVEVWITGKLVI